MAHITKSRQAADKAVRTITSKDKAAGRKTTVELPKADAPKSKKAEKTTDVTPRITVAALAKEAGKDPKAIRAKLRRMYAKDDANKLPQPVAGSKQRWTFAESQRDAVMAMIDAAGDDDTED